MIDKAKRNTLKNFSLSAAALAVAGIGSHAAAIAGQVGISGVAESVNSSANIQVHTRVSAISNDLEVVITNTGESATTITQLTPSITKIHRGQFDFSQLLENGNLHLLPGQNVSVPLTRHAVAINTVESAGSQSRSLSDALRRSFSVVTEKEALAKVNVVEGMQFA